MPERLTSTPRRLRLVTATCGVLIVGAFALAGWAFINAHRNSCNARNASLDVLRDVLVLAQPPPSDLQRLSPSKRERSNRFFAHAYARIAEARC